MGKFFYLLVVFPIIVLLVAIGLTLFNIQKPVFHKKKLDAKNYEIVLTEKTQVLTTDGTLNVVGWSRSPSFYEFNPKNIKASTSLSPLLDRLRYKKWEFFLLSHKDFYIGVGLFDLSYLGGNIFHFNDLTNLNSKVITDKNLNLINKPFIADSCLENCPASKFEIKGRFNFKSEKGFIKNSQKINFDFKDKDLNITLDSTVSCPECDSIVTSTPISQDKSLFYYNVKSYGMSQSGKLVINGKKYNLSEVSISYDSGRGVWPLSSGWLWFCSNGKTKNGESIALNIGHGFSHPESSHHTEDAFFINGKLFKLPTVVTKEVKKDYPLTDTYWSFESIEHPLIKNRCSFKMEIEKKSNLDQDFKLFKSSFEITYGRINGICKDENDKAYVFEDILAFLEDKRSVW